MGVVVVNCTEKYHFNTTLSGLLFNLSSLEFAPVSYIPEELLEIFHVNINVAYFVFGGQ